MNAKEAIKMSRIRRIPLRTYLNLLVSEVAMTMEAEAARRPIRPPGR
jgi:hypothetical protein